MRASRGALVCVVLSLAGLGLCAYLGFLHIGLLRGELLGGAACGGTGSIFNCHAVTGGRLGSVAGLPLWVWGMIGYLAALHLAFIAWAFPEASSKALTLLVSLAASFLLVDAALFVAMVTQIRYLCLFCLLTYLVNLLLFVIGKRALAQPWSAVLGQLGSALGAFLPSPRRPFAWLFWGSLTLGACGSVALHAAATYASLGSPGALQAQLNQFVASGQRTPPETSGDPSNGPSTARIELVEFSDFFCPACQRASRFNAIILASYRDETRFIFKHFPLDTACNDAIGRSVHPGACMIAAASECAHQQGKFWPFHDLMFKQGHAYNPAHLEADIQRLGINGEQLTRCLSSGEGMEAVRRDIGEGKRLGVTSTPTYFVNGLKMAGMMSPAIFEGLVDALAGKKR